MSSRIKNLKALAIAGVAGVAMAVGASAPAQATIWNITGILGPNATDGSFGYSSMHDSSTGNVRSGPILAHFGGAVADNPSAGLPPTDAGAGQYDDVTGYFQASWTIFDALGGPGGAPGASVGTIRAEGFLPDAVAGPGPSIGGFLDITVVPTAASTLLTYMGANGMAATERYWFQDLVEMALPSGFDPNTIKPDATDPTNRVMTLWGATSSVGNSAGGTNPFTSSLIGTDIRFGLEESGGGTGIPEPATLGLFGLGLAGLGIATRRRRTR